MNKIDQYNSASSIAASRASAKPAVAPAPGAGGSSSEGSAKAVSPVDKLSLTGDAQRLQQLEKSIAAIPVADHARVARTKQAIADGSYKPDAKAIAARLARTEWELRGK